MPGIVSLLPSATEWVYALGLQDDLRGVTFECDEPASARDDHRVVVTGLATEGLTPGEIDARVKQRVGAGLGLYDLDAAAMAEIAPDVVLTQDLCRVCALPAGEAQAALDAAGCPGAVVTLDPHRLAEVLDGVVAVAAATGRPDAGTGVRAALQDRLDVVASAVAGRPRPRVLVLEWTDPAYLAGHWVPDLVTAAGGEPVLALPGERSVGVGWARGHGRPGGRRPGGAVRVRARRRGRPGPSGAGPAAVGAGVGARRRRARDPPGPAGGRRRGGDGVGPARRRRAGAAARPGRARHRLTACLRCSP